MSKSFAIWLAILGWNIALVSRSEKDLSAIADEVRRAQKGKDVSVIYQAVDASEPSILKAMLDWCVRELGCKLDVLSYNAARVAMTDIAKTAPEELEKDFRASAVGTMVASQWFAEGNSRVDRIAEGEWPLFLVTGGILDKEPQPTFGSLSCAKAASQTVSRIFAKVLPDKANILVGMPLVAGRVVSPMSEEYHPRARQRRHRRHHPQALLIAYERFMHLHFHGAYFK